MVSQYIWIGITVGIFAAGIGIGFAVFQNSSSGPMMMSPQQMPELMSDPEIRQQMRDSMSQNRQFMQEAMQDSDYMQQMHYMMRENRQHMQGMMGPMMNTMMDDPEMRQQMMTHMMNNQEMMNMMMGKNMMMGNNMMNNQQILDNQNDDVYDSTETSANSQSTKVSIVRGSASPGCEKTNECYLPYSVSIKENFSVTWTNDDMAVHTATSGIPSEGPNGIFDSGLISPGKTFTNQFDEEGTFDYYCIAHPWMTGNVVVLE